MVRPITSRSRSNPPSGGASGGGARVAGFDGIRFTPERSLAEVADRLAIPDSVWSRDDFNILAISGGAAGGAFGAGVLVGLSRAGNRPDFAIVTGVSTGALIAPFAFLGADWDDRLTEAYTGGHAAQLLGIGRLAPAFSEGLFRPEALESLINPFVDEVLIAAVAEQHRRGRRLLVATTNLDAQTTCIWDMGEIATRGGERALTLFRDVLIASASLPGLFPPKRFACESDGVAYEEMHVDGGVSAPLFVMPEALLQWKKLGRRLRRSRIYVVVNTVLEQAPRATAPNLAAILIRSFDTMLRFSYRQALSSAAIFCASQNLSLSIASVPDGPDADNLMNFDTVGMRRIFNAAVDRAQTSDLWLTPTPEPPIWSSLLEALRFDPV